VPWVSTSSARPLSGQVAVVTGASSGLGQATAHRLAADGAAVALLARRADDLISTQTAIVELGGTALALPTDLADAAAIEAVVASVAAELRRVDLLVNGLYAANRGSRPLIRAGCGVCQLTPQCSSSRSR